jgi:hypothetical protein
MIGLGFLRLFEDCEAQVEFQLTVSAELITVKAFPVTAIMLLIVRRMNT